MIAQTGRDGSTARPTRRIVAPESRPASAPMTDPAVVPPSKPERVDLVPLIAANIAPIAGMVFLGWSPPMLVALYALDTAFALYAMAWLVIEHVTEAKSPERGLARALKFSGAALVVGTLLAAVLIGPMLFMYAESDFLRSRPWADRGFQGALAAQAAGSIYALWRTHRLLDERTDDDAFLKREFQFIVARWVVVLGVVFFGVASFLGETLGSALIVVVYAGATVWFTLFPDRANRMFFPDAKKEPPGGTGGGKSSA